MADTDQNGGTLAPGRFIKYDPLNPSVLFTKAQIYFIETPYGDFTESELEFIRKFEWFILDSKSLDVNYDDIPGLRNFPDTNCVYVKRFNQDRYKSMIWKFLDHIPDNYPKDDIYKLNRPAIRVIVDNVDCYYPIEYRGDLDQWQRRLRESAEVHSTLLGRFDHGKFILSDGRKLDFSLLKVERCVATNYPSDW